MNTLRLFNRQTKAVALVAMLIAATIMPALAMAATITTRSVSLSNSSKEATGVNYAVEFTAANSATGFVVDFCSNSPLPGQVCTPPEGLSVLAATSADSTKDTDETTANKFVGTKSISAGVQTITLAGVTNPDDAGTIYARILTFNSNGQQNYDSTATGANNPGAHVDEGSVAIAITDTVSVSGAVLESLSFCLSAAAIADNCASTTTPTLVLGETSGGVKALSQTAVSTGSVYTQISTNALSGAVINLKSSAQDCGGLLRAGTGTAAERCGIEPADVADAFDDATGAGKALFGVKTSNATDGTANVTGTLIPAGSYNNSTYYIGFTSGNGTGVTSVYGDPLLSTNSAPASNKNMQLTFGASISNNTPAGLYSADLSLIATGKF